MATYAVIKPYGMLSQFTPEAGHLLSNCIPQDVYPVGASTGIPRAFC